MIELLEPFRASSSKIHVATMQLTQTQIDVFIGPIIREIGRVTTEMFCYLLSKQAQTRLRFRNYYVMI